MEDRVGKNFQNIHVYTVAADFTSDDLRELLCLSDDLLASSGVATVPSTGEHPLDSH